MALEHRSRELRNALETCPWAGMPEHARLLADLLVVLALVLVVATFSRAAGASYLTLCSMMATMNWQLAARD
jgi:hypothetical protein